MNVIWCGLSAETEMQQVCKKKKKVEQYMTISND